MCPKQPPSLRNWVVTNSSSDVKGEAEAAEDSDTGELSDIESFDQHNGKALVSEFRIRDKYRMFARSLGNVDGL
jgi:hypothetical protein